MKIPLERIPFNLYNKSLVSQFRNFNSYIERDIEEYEKDLKSLKDSKEYLNNIYNSFPDYLKVLYEINNE